MSIFDSYQTASFRNVPFVLDSESTSDGRKTVSHEFVNSDKRFVEDLGRIPVVFQISGFVHGSPGFAERDALKSALDKKGPGQLVHPVYGTVTVVADPYSVNSSMRSAGRFNFRLTFRSQNSSKEPFVQQSKGVFSDTINPDKQNILITPLVALSENPNFATNSQLAVIAQNARDLASQTAQSIFEKATDTDFFDKISETYQMGIDKIRNVTGTIEDTVTRSLGLTSIDRFFKDPPGFLANPSILFPQLSNLYRSLSGAGSFNKWIEASKNFTQLFSLGTDTLRSQNINKAYGSLVSNYQLNGLINAYQSGVTTNFNTASELEVAENKLNDLFQEIINNHIDNSIVINNDIVQVILEMRNTSKLIFSQKKQNTFKVVAFKSERRSILQTTYDLYESLDNLTILVDLNQNINASNPKKPLQVVQI